MALLHIDRQLMRHTFNLSQSHSHTRASPLRHGCLLSLLSPGGLGGLKTVTTTGMCLLFTPSVPLLVGLIRQFTILYLSLSMCYSDSVNLDNNAARHGVVTTTMLVASAVCVGSRRARDEGWGERRACGRLGDVFVVGGGGG